MTDSSASQNSAQQDAEEQLIVQIERLRRQQPNTLQLYVEVARLLFFDYAIIPTTNRMYQLVRRGSMGTPAQALKMFWAQLRDEAQIRMQQAALPASLVQQAEQLLAQLWDEAVLYSDEHMQRERLQVQTEIQKWHKKLELLQQQCQTLLAEQEQLHKELTNKDKELENRAQLFGQQVAQIELLQAELKHAHTTHQEQIKHWQQEHAALNAQVEQSKQAALESEQRAQAHEKRALLEIEAARQKAKQSIEQLTQSNQQLTMQLNEMRLRHELENELVQSEVRLVQQQLSEAKADKAQLNQEIDKLKRQIRRLEQRIYRQQQRRLRAQRAK